MDNTQSVRIMAVAALVVGSAIGTVVGVTHLARRRNRQTIRNARLARARSYRQHNRGYDFKQLSFGEINKAVTRAVGNNEANAVCSLPISAEEASEILKQGRGRWKS